jgi:hypothetical protein
MSTATRWSSSRPAARRTPARRRSRKSRRSSTSATITGATFGTGNVLGLPVYVRQPGQHAGRVRERREHEAGRPRFYIPVRDRGRPTFCRRHRPETSGVLRSTATSTQLRCIVAGSGDDWRNAITVEDQYGQHGHRPAVVTDRQLPTRSWRSRAATRRPRRASSTTVVAKGDRIGRDSGRRVRDCRRHQRCAGGRGQHGVQGTLVTGLTTAATATSNDVRGTYAPRTAPDGATRYALLVQLVDPDFLGQTPYAG